VSLEYHKLLVYDDPRRFEWDAGIFYYTGWTRCRTTRTSGAARQLLSGEIGLAYSNTRKSQAAWTTRRASTGPSTACSTARRQDLPEGDASFDIGFALPLGNSSIWLYNARRRRRHGARAACPTSTSAASTTTTWTTARWKRYREYDTFPGFEIDALGGRRFLRNMLEWNAPPLRFRGRGQAGLLPVLHPPAAFVGSLVIEDSIAGGTRRYQNAGCSST
jgi:hypothetical protein